MFSTLNQQQQQQIIPPKEFQILVTHFQIAILSTLNLESCTNLPAILANSLLVEFYILTAASKPLLNRNSSSFARVQFLIFLWLD